MGKPTNVQLVAMKRVLRFLVGTMTHGILLQFMIGGGITAYFNADWRGDTNDRSSMGFLVYVNGSLVSWSSRKYGTVTCSSTEAEYRTIASTTQEIEVVCASLIELGLHVPFPMKIYTDNLGTSFIARNPIAHIHLKHVALDLHFVCEWIEKGELLVEHILGCQQWANKLTESLPPKSFQSLHANLVGALSLTQEGGLDQSDLIDWSKSTLIIG